jgi:hypothetical protein
MEKFSLEVLRRLIIGVLCLFVFVQQIQDGTEEFSLLEWELMTFV